MDAASLPGIQILKLPVSNANSQNSYLSVQWKTVLQLLGMAV